MAHRTIFAGLAAPDLGDNAATVLNGDFIYTNPDLVDQFLRIGAKSHRHDAHASLQNPHVAPALALASGGNFQSDTEFFITYTLSDRFGGETAPAQAAFVTVGGGVEPPSTAPTGSAGYGAGIMPDGSYAYAFTYTDGLGGETTLSPVTWVYLEPGHASAQVLISGLAQGEPPAGNAVQWRLWRSYEGADWHLVSQGASDTFIDSGFDPPDNPARPPALNTTTGSANAITVTFPTASAEPAISSAAAINLYISTSEDFPSPSLYASVTPASAGHSFTIYSYTVSKGSPPPISTSIGGANRILGVTDIIDWQTLTASAQGALPGSADARGALVFQGAGGATVTLSSLGGGSALVTIHGASAGGGGGGGGGASGSANTLTREVDAGNFGGAYTLDLLSNPNQIVMLSGTLNASACTLTLANRAPGCQVYMALSQGGSGNGQLFVGDGTTSQSVVVPSASGAFFGILALCPDSSSIDVLPLSIPGAKGDTGATGATGATGGTGGTGPAGRDGSVVAVEDGSTRVTPVSDIKFTGGGASVLDLTGGSALVTISGGGGGGSTLGVGASAGVLVVTPDSYLEFGGSGGIGVAVQNLGGGSARVVIGAPADVDPVSSSLEVAGSAGITPVTSTTYVDFAASGDIGLAVQNLGNGSARVLLGDSGQRSTTLSMAGGSAGGWNSYNAIHGGAVFAAPSYTVDSTGRVFLDGMAASSGSVTPGTDPADIMFILPAAIRPSKQRLVHAPAGGSSAGTPIYRVDIKTDGTVSVNSIISGTITGTISFISLDGINFHPSGP